MKKERYAIINVGLLYGVIVRDYKSVKQAAASWGTSAEAIEDLLSGKIPRLDALKRILDGAKLSAEEVILAPAHKKTDGPQRRVLPGRWENKRLTSHEG